MSSSLFFWSRLWRAMSRRLRALEASSRARSAARRAREGELDILIGTDCISEGQNLQDCDFLINYDIHWNPVRLMQRIGRVDRRMNPEIEERLLADHPEIAPSRGKVSFWMVSRAHPEYTVASSLI